MKSKVQITWMAGALLLAALMVLAACEDSGLTAPSDGLLTLTANPAGVTIDPNQGETSTQSLITAAVFDAGGRPLQNIQVLFSTTGGVLDSAPPGATVISGVATNANGIANDILTLGINDPAAVQVTAQSSALNDSVQVDKFVVGQDELPRAAIIDIPTGSQIAGSVATFDGSVSLDPDGVITCYQWTIDSNIDLYDETIQGVGASGIQRTYPEEMNLSIILRVSDDPLIGAQCDPLQPPIPANQFSPFIAVIPYVIECNNPPPLADAGPDIAQSVQSSNLVQLDGTGSFDRETPIASYRWACGNGFPPQPSAASAVVICRYQAVGVYEAQLTVCDQGTPPVMGNFVCQKCSTDTATVTIFDPLNP